jgi:isoleucyl-tRNA synthetase
VRLQAKPGWAAAQGKAGVVVLSTELTPALIAEGLAREVVHVVQGRRRDINCKYTDRIRVGVATDSAEIKAAVEQFGDYIRGETLAIDLSFEPLAGVDPFDIAIGENRATIYVKLIGVIE